MNNVGLIILFIFGGCGLCSCWYASYGWCVDKFIEFFPLQSLGLFGKVLIFLTAPLLAFTVIVGGLIRRLLDFSVK